MRKNKLLIAVLLVGLLLCGIGGGIMFLEFMDMDYVGEHVLQTGIPKTETMELSLEEYPEGPVHVECYLPAMFPIQNHVVVDETMEEGKVLVETTYNPETVTPSISVREGYWESDTDDNEMKAEPVLQLDYWSRGNDIAVFFQMKDMILKDLKNKTLRSYNTVDVMDLTITVGPKTAQRLVF